jgi:hypothetical protein
MKRYTITKLLATSAIAFGSLSFGSQLVKLKTPVFTVV